MAEQTLSEELGMLREEMTDLRKKELQKKEIPSHELIKKYIDAEVACFEMLVALEDIRSRYATK